MVGQASIFHLTGMDHDFLKFYVIAITCKVRQEEDNDSGDNDDGKDDTPEEPRCRLSMLTNGPGICALACQLV